MDCQIPTAPKNTGFSDNRFSRVTISTSMSMRTPLGSEILRIQAVLEAVLLIREGEVLYAFEIDISWRRISSDASA